MVPYDSLEFPTWDGILIALLVLGIVTKLRRNLCFRQAGSHGFILTTVLVGSPGLPATLPVMDEWNVLRLC